MPRYEFRCRACGATFEVSRPMAEASAPCPCPEGHDDTVKLLSTVSVGGRAGGSGPSGSGGIPRGSAVSPRAGAAQAQSGGCCGGACGCGK